MTNPNIPEEWLERINQAIEDCMIKKDMRPKLEKALMFYISDAIRLYLMGYAQGRERSEYDMSMFASYVYREYLDGDYKDMLRTLEDKIQVDQKDCLRDMGYSID